LSISKRKNKNDNKKRRRKMTQERGSAELNIVLSDGIITVSHSEGETLAKWIARHGDWNRLFDFIKFLQQGEEK